MSEQLNPNGTTVRLGNVNLRTPGLAGTASLHSPNSQGMRAAELTTDALDTALSAESVEPQETIQLTQTREVDVGGETTRSTTFEEPAMEVEVSDPGADWGQFVLAVDEAGVANWSFARDEHNAIDVTRGGEKRTYLIRRYVADTPGAAETRGLIGAVGTKLIKILVFPMIDPLIGAVGDHFAARWEAKNRPYRVRTFSAQNYREAAEDLRSDDWTRLSGGRALLMVHGTFSQTHTAFGALPVDFLSAVHGMYAGRVFGFDHYTMSHDPRTNAEWLFSQIPDGVSLDLDIICHSRGGLVSRVLAEKQGELSIGSKQLRINKIIFAAAPNAGTRLADSRYLSDLLDSYTNLLNFFPDVGVLDILQAVITVAKQLAVGAVKGLDGLQSMLPGGPFLDAWLNTGPRVGARYFALAADYEPTDAGLAAFIKNRLMDKIFTAQNDLVVPTQGVYDVNGAESFPIVDRHVFPAAEGITHSGFFSSAVARSRMLEWLSA